METPTIEPTDSENIPTLENEDIVQGQIVKEVIGENIHFDSGIAGSVSAQDELSVQDSLVFMARSEGDMKIQDSGAMSMVAGRDMQLTNGGAQVIVAGGGMQLTNGGAQLIVAGGDLTAQKSFFGVAVANQLNLSEDSKVLLDKPQAILFGAAFGVVFALVSFLLKRRQ